MRLLLFIATLAVMSTTAWSHGFVGKRFFPSAITEDEPFINDKLALPVYYSQSPAPNGGDTWTTNPKLEYAKTITKFFQASVTASYLHIKNPGEDPQNGFDDWTVGMRYNLFIEPQSETIFSVGLNATLGGTGSQQVNAASTTTVSPEILFAQGMGILPESIKWLRPFGFSVSLEPNFMTSNMTVNSVSWGMGIEYSLPYLRQFIYDFDIPLLNHMVPIVEFPFSTCTQGNCKGRTTGTIDPGVIFYGRYGQVGIEALIPSNADTGSKVGGVIQFYLYLDAIFPNSIGKPLF